MIRHKVLMISTMIWKKLRQNNLRKMQVTKECNAVPSLHFYLDSVKPWSVWLLRHKSSSFYTVWQRCWTSFENSCQWQSLSDLIACTLAVSVSTRSSEPWERGSMCITREGCLIHRKNRIMFQIKKLSGSSHFSQIRILQFIKRIREKVITSSTSFGSFTR